MTHTRKRRLQDIAALVLPCIAMAVLFTSTPQAWADEHNGAPMILGEGTNLAHWLSQTRRTGKERREFILEKDIAYIAQLGFDHVRLPIDEEQMWNEDGERDDDAFAALHDGIRWSLKHDLKVVIDLHILRSHHFNAADKPLWTEAAAQERFIELWRDLSSDLRDYPLESVAYELMNEPVADDPDDWNKLVAKALQAVRELEPNRTVVIGSNRWQSADTFDELAVPDDRNIILSFHFYEPFMLSHYGASWTEFGDYTGPVHYPGVVLTQEEFEALPESRKQPARRFVGREFNRQVLTEMMEKPLRVAKALGLPLYCGEFGIFNKAPAADRVRWYADIRAIFAEHDVSYANWNYKSDQFGFVDYDGQAIEDMRDALAPADFSSFSTGPAIEEYGPVSDVKITYAIPKDAVLRHSFDVGQQAGDGELNRTLVSAARFINMHARAGIDMDRIQLAVVVHGKAVHDVSNGGSGSEGLVAALVDHGVSIIVCGQSAAYYDVATDDLLPGVEMAISAMTAHALLQQQGYTLNPF